MLYLRNLSYHPAASAKPILNSVSLEFAPQKLGLIIGPSGSGKTTLLEILAGLTSPSSGNIYWREQELTALQLRQLAGLVFQFPERHFCGATLFEELRLGHPDLTREKVSQVLEELGLDHLPLHTSPYTLSGGQQRRLALAVQLIRQPHVLLLDEPMAGLDWSMRQQLVALLARLKQHWSLLVVSHDASELIDIADYCWTIQQGFLHSVNVQDLATSRQQPPIIGATS